MATLTLTVAASTDDANLSDAGYSDNEATMVFGGTGSNPANHGSGFRFTGGGALDGATINSAYLYLMKSGGAWQGIATRLTTEAADSGATFSSGSPPGSRAIATNIADDIPDRNMIDGTFYDFPSNNGDKTTLGAAIQEVTDRAGYTDTLVVVCNSDQDAGAYTTFARSPFHTYDSGTADSEPQLVIDYTAAAGPAATTGYMSTWGRFWGM